MSNLGSGNAASGAAAQAPTCRAHSHASECALSSHALQQQSANFSVLLKVAQLKPSAKVALLTQAATGHPSAFQTAVAGAARRRIATTEGLMAVAQLALRN